MLNHITVMGRLVRDPELRRTKNGIPVASFSVACDRDYKVNGEKSTDVIDIVAWRSTAEFVSRYFTKGRMAVIDGRLQLRGGKQAPQRGNPGWQRQLRRQQAPGPRRRIGERSCAYDYPSQSGRARPPKSAKKHGPERRTVEKPYCNIFRQDI